MVRATPIHTAYKFKNGEGGIRTHDDLRHNCLAGSPVQPLLHLSRYLVAVGVGFEPTVACATTVFKTAAFVHSAIPPFSQLTDFNYNTYKICCQVIFTLGLECRVDFLIQYMVNCLYYYLVL